MSQILMGDSQKLSFSTLIKVPLLIRQIPSTHQLCPRSLQPVRGLHGQKLFVDGVCPMTKIYIFEILMKNYSKYVSPNQVRLFFSKSGHPYFLYINDLVMIYSLSMVCDTVLLLKRAPTILKRKRSRDTKFKAQVAASANCNIKKTKLKTVLDKGFTLFLQMQNNQKISSKVMHKCSGTLQPRNSIVVQLN